MIDLSAGQTFNAAAFVLNNNLVNENGDPINFKYHKFLLDFYMDNSPEIVAEKCSQVGFSTTAIVKAIHLARYRQANIIYLLPSKTIVNDFVVPKVDPLIASNPAFRDIMGDTDSRGLKSVGMGREQRFIYFRSSWDERSGISLSAHVLISDEYDRSNRKAVETYKTRLDAARLTRPDLGWDWRFSNPTIEGAGVDELYQKSDQKRWMIKCERCNHWQNLVWPDNINIETKQYICAKCTRPMSDEARARGQWVKSYFGREISGYRISQLMAPWIPASEIIKDSLGDQSIFYNFTLGLPFTSKDIVVTREALTKCLYPSNNPMVNNAMGVDNGIIKHYVIGNKYGIFKVGSTDDWQVIENLRNQYSAYMVCDSNPYPTPVMKLAAKYPGKVFAHFYNEDSKTDETIQWGEGDRSAIVKSDRTKIIDSVVADINAQDLLFNMSLTELENQEYIKHWLNMYRIVEVSAKGIQRGVWRNIEGKPDHLAHATVYFKVAQQMTLAVGGVAHTAAPKAKENPKEALYTNPDGTVETGFDLDKLKDQFNRPKVRNWLRS